MKPRYLFGSFMLNPNIGLLRDGQLVHLAPKELALLELLVMNAGNVVSHRQIEATVWPRQLVNYSSTPRCISSLRQRLGGPRNQFIQTVSKRGYRIACDTRVVESDDPSLFANYFVSASAEAFSDFMEGQRAANRHDPNQQARAYALFQQAVARDPGYVAAYVALADTQMYRALRGYELTQTTLESGVAACRSALKLNPDNVQAQCIMAWFEGVMLLQFPGALQRLKKALSGKTEFARGFAYQSWVLRCSGDLPAALEAAKIAQRIDPHSILHKHLHAWTLHLLNRTEEAIDRERFVLANNPRDVIALGYLGLFLSHLGEHKAALEASREALRLSNRNPAVATAHVHCLAHAGERQEARSLLNKLPTGTTPRAPRTLMAFGWMAVRDFDRAQQTLALARKEACPWYAAAAWDPRAEPARGRPEFEGLFALPNEGHG
mgnify:FL=1